MTEYFVLDETNGSTDGPYNDKKTAKKAARNLVTMGLLFDNSWQVVTPGQLEDWRRANDDRYDVGEWGTS